MGIISKFASTQNQPTMTPTAPVNGNPSKLPPYKFGLQFLIDIPIEFREYFQIEMLNTTSDTILVVGPPNAECGHTFTFTPTKETSLCCIYDNKDDECPRVKEVRIIELDKFTITFCMDKNTYVSVAIF